MQKLENLIKSIYFRNPGEYIVEKKEINDEYLYKKSSKEYYLNTKLTFDLKKNNKKKHLKGRGFSQILSNIKKQEKIFLLHKNDLKKQFLNFYVAFYNGEVLAYEKDEKKLRRKIFDDPKIPRDVLIKKITKNEHLKKVNIPTTFLD